MIAFDIVLVVSLGDDRQTVRDAAESVLFRRGCHAMRAVDAGRRSQDAEIRHRCHGLYQHALGDLLTSFEPVPEIDAAWFDAFPRWWTGRHPAYRSDLFSDRYERMCPYLDAVGRDRTPWPNYYTATRLWLRTEIEAGTDLESLRILLDEMHERDRVFLWQHHHKR